MTIAVVAEKPSVARDIAASVGARNRHDGYLSGNGWIITWAIGHLVGLAQPHEVEARWKAWRRDHLPMLPNRWPLVVLPGAEAQFAVVRSILADRAVREVICATDAGREGELIFRFIYEAAAVKKPVRRLWISSLTPEAIRAGLDRLRPAHDFDRLAAAARGRAQADWLVGMNLSRAYTIAHGDLLSVGRVQTPTLALLVTREHEIRTFVPEKYAEVVATFGVEAAKSEGAAAAEYRGTWFRADAGTAAEAAEPARRRLPPDRVEAEQIVARVRAAGRGVVQSMSEDTRRMPPPLLYDLSELQRHANRLYGLSAQRTLEIAQRLYEQKKLLTYPRTDSRQLPADVAATLPAVVQAISPAYAGKLAPGTGVAPLGRRFVDDAKVTDHHAIIPTATDPRTVSLSPEEAKIYDLVCRRLLSAWHGDHVYAVTHVITRVGEADLFHTRGTRVVEPGWKVLDVVTRASAERAAKDGMAPGATGPRSREDEPDVALPRALAQGLGVPVRDVEAVDKETRPPKRLTEANLLTAMETAGATLDDKELSRAMKERGLGTPATRASIIETLIAREYVVRDGKVLQPTDKGIMLIDRVHPHVKSAAMTGEWESRLRAIERGEGELEPFMRAIEALVTEVIGGVGGPLSGLGGTAAPVAAQPGPRVEPAPVAAKPVPRAAAAKPATRVEPAYPDADLEPPPHTDADFRPPPPGAFDFDDAPPPPGAYDLGPPRDVGPDDDDRPPPPRERRPSPQPREAPPRAATLATAPAPAATPAPPPDPRRAELLRLPVRERIRGLLQHTFGHAKFRPHQEEVCATATEGHDSLLVMPTGAGKSLCYQLPGLARGGTTLVVSPLIALMEDQVTKLQALGLRAARIHSGRGRVEARTTCSAYLAGQLDFLFVAPERLSVPGFVELLARRPPALIAIDEAHCISQWGHDFRPEYRMLGQRLPQLRPAPVIALTATATPTVQDDIVGQLGLDRGRRFIHGFRRSNIAIEVVEVPKPERPVVVERILADRARRPALLYTSSRKEAEALADQLSGAFRIASYHAGMSARARDQVQSDFLAGRVEVVAATIAFGMGVDKADIRSVIHLSLPQTVEGYYQEIGRAGRDGKPSRAVLLHSFVDRRMHQFFLDRGYPEVDVLERLKKRVPAEGIAREDLGRKVRAPREVTSAAIEKLWIHGGVSIDMDDVVRPGHDRWRATYLEQRAHRAEQAERMAQLSEAHDCRMLHLVRHFGDTADSGEPCGSCDVCAPDTCVVQPFRKPSAAEIGALERMLRSLRAAGSRASGTLFRELEGELPGLDRDAFEVLVSGLSRAGLVEVRGDTFEKNGETIRFQRLELTPEGYEASRAALAALSLPSAVERGSGARGRKSGAGARKGRKSKKGRGAATEGRPQRSARARAEGGAGKSRTARASSEAPDAVVDALRSWRLREAKRRKTPAFRVLTDQTLINLASQRPRSADELLQVRGMGPKLAEKYGPALLALLSRASTQLPLGD